MLKGNEKKIRDYYNWPRIVEGYEAIMLQAVANAQK
jgi:hypothetical protein